MKITEYNIELRDIHLYAYHGVIPQENIVGAWYTINLSATVSKHESIENDELDSTVNYATIYDIICEEMKTPSKLLEHVCGRILTRIFNEIAEITRMEISLAKDTPPIGADRASCAVRITAER